MTRQEYIDAVKVKIEEISPFDEPDAFIDGDPSSTVKPIISYIDKSLDEAAKNCLSSLPLTLLHADVERTNPTVVISNNGVGTFVISPNRRFIRFRHSNALERDITAFITSEDPQYLVMQNPHCRPGKCKPVAVVSSDVNNAEGQMEIYSYPASMYGTTKTDAYMLSINLNKHAENNSYEKYLTFNSKKYTFVTVVALSWEQWRDSDGNTIFTQSSDTGNVRTVYAGPNGSAQQLGSTTAFTPAYTDALAVKSPIEELIVLECARMVFNILKDYDAAKVCENEQAAKIQAILK